MFTADTIYVSGMPSYFWGWNGRFTKVRDGLYVKEQHPLWGFLPLEINVAYIHRPKDGGRWNFYVGDTSRYNKVFRGPKEESPIGYWANRFKVDTIYSSEMPLQTFAKVGMIASLSTFIYVSGYAGYISNIAVNTGTSLINTVSAYSTQLSLGATVACGGYLIGMGVMPNIMASRV